MGLTLIVKVATKDIDYLQASGFNLCLTRNIKYAGQEKPGNVVFSMVTSKDLGPNMRLEWDEKYQVFGTIQFQASIRMFALHRYSTEAGAKVTVGSDVANIEGGQTGTIQADGGVRISGSAQPGSPFNVDNQWKQPAAIGVNNFDAAAGTYHTIYVSPQVPRPSLSSLLPIQKYSVWWDMNLVTDTMFQHTATPQFPFDLTSQNTITLEYKDGIWTQL